MRLRDTTPHLTADWANLPADEINATTHRTVATQKLVPLGASGCGCFGAAVVGEPGLRRMLRAPDSAHIVSQVQQQYQQGGVHT
jgi:hypothetical protein